MAETETGKENMKMTDATISTPARLARCLLTPLFLALLVALAAAPAASAASGPAWMVKARWGDTFLPPGGKGEVIVTGRNVGDEAGSEAEDLTITDTLPPEVTITGFEGGFSFLCEGVGTNVATCTIPTFFVPFLTAAPGAEPASLFASPTGFMPPLYIEVEVDPGASGQGTNVATMSGGGAAVAGTDTDPMVFSTSPAPFGLTPGGFSSDVYDGERPGNGVVRQAGSHPYEYRFEFDLNQHYGIDSTAGEPFTEPTERLRNLEVQLPHGMVGNPEATPKCSQADFANAGVVGDATGCPPDTQIGTLNIGFFNSPNEHGNPGFGPSMLTRVALYNLEPPKGYPADIGFNAGSYVLGHIYSNLDARRGYAITSLTPDISNLLAVRDLEVTFWGVPSDPRHDKFRYYNGLGHDPALGAPFGSAPRRPFLTLPMDCGMDNGANIARVSSYRNPDQLTAPYESSDAMNVSGCDDPRIRFKPDVAIQPTSRAAGGPTGLAVNLKLTQRDDAVADPAQLYAESEDVQAIATPPVKKAVVTMPEGMTLSTSAAQGLESCTPEQIGLGSNDPVRCPDASQYGQLTVHTPLLPKDEPLSGRIFVAKQNDNPYGNFLTLYLAIEDPSRGVLVKVPGKVDLDPVTGQITTTFDDLPQVPVSNMELSLKGGVRAALVNPATCGTKTIRAEFFSWTDRENPIVKSQSYEIAQKPDGSPCVGNLRDRPFAPKLSGGTVSPLAGAYSPFVFRIERSDDDQELSQLGVSMPKGLLAKISGIAKCSDAAIAASAAPGRSGAEEKANPSCPASSEIGSTDVGSGVGQVITYIGGKAYLAGPYKGAPLSMVVITPILAGPYDLGVIAVRSKIDVDPVTTQATVTTDPFPQIFKGIPVRIRDVRVKVDRASTIINPTNCEPSSIGSHVTGTGGDVNSTADDTGADLSQRFQVSNCAALPFKPQLSFKLKGGTHRGDYPALTATLRARPGDANIARAAVTLPHSEFLAQEHIRTVCTRVQFAQNACPAASIYGQASATSPLFDQTLEGPVYLRSSSNRLPDLVAKLDGEINVVLAGRIDSVRQSIRNTFELVPDAPVSTFTLSMQGGKKSLLVNSRNLCKAPARAEVKMLAQNGKSSLTTPKVANSCRGKAARKGKRSPKRLG